MRLVILLFHFVENNTYILFISFLSFSSKLLRSGCITLILVAINVNKYLNRLVLPLVRALQATGTLYYSKPKVFAVLRITIMFT